VSPMKISLSAVVLSLLLATTAAIAQEKPGSGPSKLLAVQTSPTEITLVWQTDLKAAEYVVYGPRKRTDLGGAGVRLGSISGSGTRFVARVVAPGVEHRYALEAIRRSGAGKRLAFNAVVPTRGGSGGVVTAPKSVQAELTSPGVITLRWDSVPGATAYTIGRSVRPGGFRSLCDLCDPRRTKYVDRELVAGQVHMYSVATVTPDGRSRVARSNEVTPTGSAGPIEVATDDSTPPADAAASDSSLAADSKSAIELKAGLKSGNTVLLTWSGLLSSHRYQIRRHMGDVVSAAIATITGAMSQYLDRLPPGFSGQVGYLIEDLDGKGASKEVLLTAGTVAIDSAKAAIDSSGGTAIMDPNSKAAINLKAGLKSSNTVLLTWNGLLIGHTYQIRRRIGGALSGIVATITGAMSQYLDQLPPGISGQVGYIIEDVNGKGASKEALLSVNVARDSSKSGIDSLDPSSKGPSNLMASVVAPGVVRLSWSPLPAFGREALLFLRIYRRLENGALVVIGSVNPGLASFIDHLPGSFMGVSYAIEAVYEKGPSARATVSIDPRKDLVSDAGGAGDPTGGKGAAENPAPKGPTDVSAALTAPNTVTLTWNPVPDATYEIRRSIGTVVGQLITTIASATGRYVDQLPPLSSSKDNTVLYRISVANDRITAPVLVSIDPVQGTSETIEGPGLDSLRSPRGRGRVP
jgi:hypothetical protein